MNYQLILKDICLEVKLGYSEEERLLPQKVLLEIKLQFANLPLACTTDDLENTICYAPLACCLQEFCKDRSFKLIEALAYELYQFLKGKLEKFSEVSIFLCLTKNPPLDNLREASFVISD